MIIGISGKALSGKDTVANIIQWLILKEEKDIEIAFEDFEKYSKASDWKNVKFADKLKDMVCLILGCTREQLEDSTFKETPLGKEWIKYELRYVSHDRLSYCNCSNYYEKYFRSKEEAVEYIEGNLEVDQDSIKISKIELTPRLLLQLLGTECGREIIHPDIWVNATMAKYTLTPDPNLTITEWKDKKSFSQKEALEYIYPSGHKYPNWVISDVRFPNEAKAIKDRNGITIRVNRDTEYLKCIEDPAYFVETYVKVNNEKIELREYEKDFIKKHCKPTKEHESETALDDAEFDYVIDNNGTIEELIEKIKQILIKEKIIWKAY